MVQPLDMTNDPQAESAGWTIVDGPGMTPGVGRWELVQKAWLDSDDSRVLHTTKRMRVPGGWNWETTTTIYIGEPGIERGGAPAPFDVKSVAVAKAGWFVPDMPNTPQA